jgi:hypothetical protein
MRVEKLLQNIDDRLKIKENGPRFPQNSLEKFLTALWEIPKTVIRLDADLIMAHLAGLCLSNKNQYNLFGSVQAGPKVVIPSQIRLR